MLDLIARMKLMFDKDKEFRVKLSGILGFLPLNIEFYKIAFSHASNQYTSRKGGRKYNNERLEYLGDAILEAVVSDLLFHHFDSQREGFLTNARSKIVQRSMLNKLAKKMGVEDLVRTNTRNLSHNSNIGGNAFEALIGAIYLDRGYQACKKFVEKQIVKELGDIDEVANKEINFKSKILEYCQKNRIGCEFKLKNNEKVDGNNTVFRSILEIEGVMVGDGKGYSKKESEQNACREALLRMRRSEALVAQIFAAKEQRTSTEAPIFVAVPKIDEIEQEIAKLNEAKTERRRQQRSRQKERREEQEKVQKAQNKETAPNVVKKEQQKRSTSEFTVQNNEKKPSTQHVADVSEKAITKTSTDTLSKKKDTPSSSKEQRNKKTRDSQNSPNKDSSKPLQEKQPKAEKPIESIVAPTDETPKIPTPLFLVKDIKQGQEQEKDSSENNVSKPLTNKSRRNVRKPAKSVQPKAEETIEEDSAKESSLGSEPKKKARRNTKRKQVDSSNEAPQEVAGEGKKKSKRKSTTTRKRQPSVPQPQEAPTLPFAPQE